MQKRNLIILVTCQLISATGAIVFVTLGGIIGATLTTKLAWATLPVSVMVLATAATTVPATLIMHRFGRSRGFVIASLSAAAAALTAAWALSTSSLSLFLVAGAMFGINMAFTQQYRYAAAESVPAKYAPRDFICAGWGNWRGIYRAGDCDRRPELDQWRALFRVDDRNCSAVRGASGSFPGVKTSQFRV